VKEEKIEWISHLIVFTDLFLFKASDRAIAPLSPISFLDKLTESERARKDDVILQLSLSFHHRLKDLHTPLLRLAGSLLHRKAFAQKMKFISRFFPLFSRTGILDFALDVQYSVCRGESIMHLPSQQTFLDGVDNPRITSAPL
jgi:hypothetical protein